MRIYDLVKQILEENPDTRNSDKKLIWKVWEVLDLTGLDVIIYDNFMKAPSSESITRARRKIQELHPSLQATESVRRQRQQIEDQRGTYIFREEIKEQVELF